MRKGGVCSVLLLGILLCLFTIADGVNPSDFDKDFYKALRVKPNSSAKTIKAAYRNMARKYHPDRYPEEREKEKATRKFAEVAEAYEVLSDPQKRKEYDIGRRDRQLGSEQAQNFGQSKPTFGQSKPMFGSGMQFDFGNLFSQGFGGAFDSFGSFGDRFHQHFPQRNRAHDAGASEFDWEKVIKLNGKHIMKSIGAKYRLNRIWVVFFYKEKNLVLQNAMVKVADHYDGLAMAGAIDCSLNRNGKACRHFQVSKGQQLAFPFVRIFSNDSITKLVGSKISKKEIGRRLNQVILDRVVIIRSARDSEKFTRECIQSNAYGCIVMLSDRKKKPYMPFARLTAENNGKIKFAYWYVVDHLDAIAAHEFLTKRRHSDGIQQDVEFTLPLLYQIRTGGIVDKKKIPENAKVYTYENVRAKRNEIRSYAKLLVDLSRAEKREIRRGRKNRT